MATRFGSNDPDASLVDPPRMSEFQRRLYELAKELGFRVTTFDVNEQRLSSQWPVVAIEVQQGPVEKEGHDG